MRYIELPIPVDHRVPEGYSLILAYSNGKDIVAPLNVCDLENEEDHNCDWEGCSSREHVFRCSPEQKYALERSDRTKEEINDYDIGYTDGFAAGLHKKDRQDTNEVFDMSK